MTDFSTQISQFLARCEADASVIIEETCELALAGGEHGVKVWRWWGNGNSHTVVAVVDPSVPYRTIEYAPVGEPHPGSDQLATITITEEKTMPLTSQGREVSLDVSQLSKSEQEGQILVTAESDEMVVSWLVDAETEPTIGSPVRCTVTWRTQAGEQ